MKKNLSWKLLLPLGLAIWIIGRISSETFIGSAGALLGIIILLMGIIDGGRALFKKKEVK